VIVTVAAASSRALRSNEKQRKEISRLRMDMLGDEKERNESLKEVTNARTFRAGARTVNEGRDHKIA
jgi:hypothetical protein